MSVNLSMQDLISYTLRAHASGYTPPQIHAQLVARGHTRTSLSTVEQCLHLNGYAIPNNTPRPVGKAWNTEADRLTVYFHRLGKSVRQIWHELRIMEYAVSEADVVASLNAQGIYGVSVTDGR